MMENEVRRKVERACSGYERGMYTHLEASSQVFECITPSNVSDVLAALPEILVSRLRSDAESAPRSEKDWQDLRLFGICSGLSTTGYDPPIESDDDSAKEENKRDYRVRIEALRQYFGGSA
jgi:hypothetical protein